jgi:hypothetical protein
MINHGVSVTAGSDNLPGRPGSLRA